MKPSHLFVAAVGVVMSIAGLAAAGTTVAVTACGQRVLDDGYLVGDLDCTADEVSGYPAVTMAGNGSLDLRGFTITGGTNAVQCEVRCQVFGGSIGYGYLAGVSSLGRATITDMSIVGRSPAVGAGKIIAERSTFTTNWSGLWAASGSVVMIDSVISDGAAYGVLADRRATLRNSSVTGNALSGVYTSKAVVRDSTVTGNATDADCNVTGTCADLYTATQPRLRRSTCDSSKRYGGAVIPGGDPDWGICSLD
jgi:hypothetical protein